MNTNAAITSHTPDNSSAVSGILLSRSFWSPGSSGDPAVCFIRLHPFLRRFPAGAPPDRPANARFPAAVPG